MTDYYEILGVPKNADEKEIKKAYRALSLKYHPDRNSEPDASEQFQKINEAHETLSDPQKREQYDNGGLDQQMGQEFHDINHIFNMMFGGGMPQGMPGMPNIHVFNHQGGGGFHQHFFQQMTKPQPIIKTVEIELEQAYHGATIVIGFERQVVYNGIQSSETEMVNIDIPKGISENEIMIMRDKGHCINESSKGDLKLVFKINNKTHFIRQDQDLRYKKTITLKEALCGFTFELKHINGKVLSMNNTSKHAIVKPNYKKIIPLLGMQRGNHIGNLVIEFTIDFPDNLSEQQIDQLNDIL
jgi:DnaJ-class molecular chaperone